MKLIVGLGNPGKKYQNTRHNIGYKVIDELRKKKLPKNVVVKKSGVFMNSSGAAVFSLATYYKLQAADIYVVHDDLDLKLGDYKIQFAKGPKNHKGLNSVYQRLGTRDFWHVRVGIDNRSSVISHQSLVSGEDYVLVKFSDEEQTIIDAIIDKVVWQLKEIFQK